MSKLITFNPPAQGRMWENGNDEAIPVTILGIDLDSGSAIIVDEDAILHSVPYRTVDFLSLVPKGTN